MNEEKLAETALDEYILSMKVGAYKVVTLLLKPE
jgi:hypothetical protein